MGMRGKKSMDHEDAVNELYAAQNGADEGRYLKRAGMYRSVRLGMAIPRRISFLEESRNRGMTNLHSSGIEEYEIYSSGSSGNFEE